MLGPILWDTGNLLGAFPKNGCFFFRTETYAQEAVLILYIAVTEHFQTKTL